MQIAHADELEWRPLSQIRQGGKEYKELLAGEEGALDNYRLVMIREEGVKAVTPRHKHNFDQLRMVLTGRANYGPKRWIEPGQIAYFPEGTPYGPEDSDGDRLGLTWQAGGASGSGYISNRQAKAATEELKQAGTFEGGIYYRNDGSRPQDSFEAVWERVNQRKLEYPKPRYDEPLLIRPEHFAWQEQSGQPGVEHKLLAAFTERRMEIAMLRVGAGANALFGPQAGIQTVYALGGAGTVDGHAIHAGSAFAVAAGAAADISATSTLELIVVGLPIFARVRETANV